jgi:hypothetical protein
MGSLAGLPIGFALAGILTEVLGVDWVLIGMSVSAFFLTVWLLMVPDVRRIGAREEVRVDDGEQSSAGEQPAMLQLGDQ